MTLFRQKSKFAVAILLVAIMMVQMIPVVVNAASSKPTITVSSASATAGEKVTVTLSLSNNPGITVMKLLLSYPDELELTKVEETAVFEDCTKTHSEELSSNPYVLYWHGDLLKENIKTNGSIVKLTFKVSESATSGTYTISVTPSSGEVFNADLEDVTFSAVNGKITVKATETTTDKNETTTAESKTTTTKSYDTDSSNCSDLGHNVVNWEETKPATVDDYGERKGMCTRCNEEITEKIDKLIDTSEDIDADDEISDFKPDAVDDENDKNQNLQKEGSLATVFIIIVAVSLLGLFLIFFLFKRKKDKEDE